MHLNDQEAAIRAARRDGLVDELVRVLKKASDLLLAHETSARPAAAAAAAGAYPTIHVSGEEWANLSRAVRDALAKVEGAPR